MQSNDDTRFYVDGAWVDRPDAPRIAVTNPYSEETIGYIAAGSAADVDLAVAAARRAFGSFSQTSVAERLALLERIRDLLEERSEQFAQAIVAEMGAAISFARAGQCHFGIEHVRAKPIAAPISATMACANCSLRSSSKSLMRSSSASRSATDVCENPPNARRAAVTARSTSAGDPAAICPIVSSDQGLVTAIRGASGRSVHTPSM